MSKQDIVEEMEMAVEQIREAVDALARLAVSAVHEGMIGETEQYRLDRGALAHIKTALSNDHEFLGGNMFTVHDTIEAIKHLGDKCPECGADLEQNERGVYDCPAGC